MQYTSYKTFTFLIQGKVPLLKSNIEYLYNIFNRNFFIEDSKIIKQLLANPNKLSVSLKNKLLASGFIYLKNKPPYINVRKGQIFTIWFHITNICNLNCPYCFVNKLKPNNMDLQEAIQYLKKIIIDIKKHNYTKLKIKYTGGEPLLPEPFNRIKLIHKKLRPIAKKFDIQLEEIIITNGTNITMDMLQFIKQENFSLVISIDGWGKIHDKTRKTINGQSTFKTIIENIHKHSINFNLSVVANKYNTHNIYKLLEFAFDRPKPIGVKLNFIRDNPNTTYNVVPKISKLIRDLKKAYITATKLIIKYKHSPILLNSLLDYIDFTFPKDFTCEASRAYMSLESGGYFNTCHMFINKKNHNIKQSNDIIESLNNINIPKRISVDQKDTCKICPIKYICGGGCPLLTKYIYKTYNHPSFYCTAYKQLAPFLLGLIAYIYYLYKRKDKVL